MDDVYPFLTYPRRERTGTTPPSPPGSPPETTPWRLGSPTKEDLKWSPYRFPLLVPIFNEREVHSPTELMMSPFYGHSTPKAAPPNKRPPGGWTPESEARKHRWEARRRAFAQERGGLDEIFFSPITHRQDCDSCFAEPLISFNRTPPPPETSPIYPQAETPARSPALELMRQEMKQNDDQNKYGVWYYDNVGKAAMRDEILKVIHSTLAGRFPGIDYEKLNVYQSIALLNKYIKHITEKLLTQNLELPKLPENNPALNFLEQKRISIRRIIKEYRQQFEKTREKLELAKQQIVFYCPPGTDLENLDWYEEYKKELEELRDPEKRMERIVAKRGVCPKFCSNRRQKNEFYRQNKPLEEELDDLRRKNVEMDAECMEAMADMTQFVDYVSPNFLKNLAGFVRTLYPGSRFHTIPPEAYEEASKDLSKHLRRIFKQKRQEFVEANREVNTLYPMIKEKREELDRINTDIEKCQNENLRLRVEFKKYTSHSRNIEWMLKEARGLLEFYEQEHARAYQALNREKKRTVKLEAELSMTPRGPPQISRGKELPRTSSPIITLPRSPNLIASPPGGAIGSPAHASSPAFRSSPTQQETSVVADSLGRELPPSAMLNISDLSQSGDIVASERTLRAQDQYDNLEDERPPSEMLDFSGLQGGGSFLDSPENSASPGKKTLIIPSPGKMEPLRMDVEIIPQDIRRSPSGQRVVCDVAVQMQEVALRPPRRIEKRYKVVRGTPPLSQTVGRRVDRRHGMFTPRSAIRRQHIGVRRPLFEGDFESPDSPWGTGRRTHPELMNLPQRAPSPRPPHLNTTIEWEDPKMNTGFGE